METTNPSCCQNKETSCAKEVNGSSNEPIVANMTVKPNVRANSIVGRTGLKWVEYLEREFDTAFVDIDTCLNNLDDENVDVAFDVRNRMTALSASFAQLVHKSILVFESNARLDEQLEGMRRELIESRAQVDCLVKQLEDQESKADQPVKNHVNDVRSRRVPSLATPEPPVSPKKKTKNIQHQLELSLKNQEVINFRNENKVLRKHILSLETDLFGARLASKYLDKELAGRIQQIQLLAKSDLKGVEHDRLWNQIESEIHLHRHKTVVRACRGRNSSLNRINMANPIPGTKTLVRNVKVVKKEGEGLGISVTGGKEHGIPIIISDIHSGSPADMTASLYIGDAILSINGIDLKDKKHLESAEILSKQTGDCFLEVMFVYPEEELTYGSEINHEKRHEDDQLDCSSGQEDKADMTTHPGSRRISREEDSTANNSSESDDNLSSVTDVIKKRETNLYPGRARLCVSQQTTCSSRETTID